MNRTSEICRTILTILHQCSGHALPEETLQEHLDVKLRPAVPEADRKTALEYLTSEGLARSLPGLMGSEELRWLITEKGEVSRLQ